MHGARDTCSHGSSIPADADVAANADRSRRTGALRARACALALFAILPLDATATVAINAPWVRVTAGAATAEVYMELESSSSATLVAAHTDAARSVTIRPPGKRSAPIAGLPLPAGTLVKLFPGGARLGLVQLTRALKLGERIPLTLVVRGADGKDLAIPITAEVRRRSPIEDERRAHSH